ncbi:MAG: outer membrane beta-barrel protein [Bacteroidales bacterium]|nr:outer membrane beta-barrel protein [Bacteroidales bacterium]
MKKFFMAALLMLAAGSAMAQLVNSDDYFRLQVSYVGNQMTNTDNDPKGVALGGIYGISVSDQIPLFVEIGAQLEWAHSVNDIWNTELTPTGNVYTRDDCKFTYMNISIPLNAAYKYTINDKVAVSGHAGLNFKVNMLAKQKAFDTTLNLLDKDDMGGRDNRNIFQLGGQVGAGVHFGQLYLGWQYQGDFMPIAKFGNNKVKFHTNYVTVGFTL